MSVVLAVVLALNFSNSSAPKWFSPLLAGYLLENDESHRDVGVYDKRTGYYLIRYAEGDGANLTLLLTRDRKMIQDQGYKVPSLPDSGNTRLLAEKSLPSLKTGKGIKIGDTKSQVQSLLGKPHKTSTEGSANQYDVLSYQAAVKADPKKVGSLGQFWQQRYVFKENRLIEICFYRGLD